MELYTYFEKIKYLSIEETINSDHRPVLVNLDLFVTQIEEPNLAKKLVF